MDTPKTKAKRKTHYRRDLLTRQSTGGNWVLQFRVPERLRGIPPYGDRPFFKKSLKTKDYAEALQRRDQFLKANSFHDAAEDAAEAAFNRTAAPRDHYWNVMNAVDASGGLEELNKLAQELQGQIQDIHEEGRAQSSRDRLLRLEAQRDAILRLRDEHFESVAVMAERPHPYEVDLKKAVTDYTEEMEARKLATKSIGKLSTAFKRYVEFSGRTPELRSIRRSSVAAYIRAQRDKGVSRATVSNDLTFLGSAFGFAQEQGYLPDSLANPFRDHRLSGFAEREQRERYTEDQLLALLKATADDKELTAAIYLGYYTGMRISELFTCTLSGTGNDQVWQVATSGGKTAAATRIIPVSEGLRLALTELGFMPEVGKSVPWKTKTDQAIGKRFGRLKATTMKELGETSHTKYTFHSLRHGFITALVEAGITELEFADLTGHSKGTIARTEAGRSYARNQLLPKLKKMMEAVPPLPSPKEINPALQG